MIRYSLGLDISTQSLTGLVLDCMHHTVVCEIVIPYTDNKLRHHTIDEQHKILSPRVEGEADQPPLLFLDALDIFFAELQGSGINLEHIDVINVSAQQHGHVYLNASAYDAFARIASTTQQGNSTLSTIFANSFSYDRAPIWMTSVSSTQADEIRDIIGGTKPMVALSGSDSPARFTGAVIRNIGQRYPDAYRHTTHIHLLGSFITAILTGMIHTPIDWGNGSGMSLMNYSSKKWSARLLEAVSRGLPSDGMQVRHSTKRDTAIVEYDGKRRALSDAAWILYQKIPKLCSPLDIADTLASYFVSRYGCNPYCCIVVGSGDNPQSKVTVMGDMLSMGSSMVIMAEQSHKGKCDVADTASDTVFSGINAMYDGVGNPFVFACRTNGALLWDDVRVSGSHPLSYDECEILLACSPIGAVAFLWQPFAESFPVSSMFDPCTHTKKGNIVSTSMKARKYYPAIIDTTLAIMHYHAAPFMGDTNKPLYVTGGPTQSQQILRRVAAFWSRPIIPIGSAGAALGAAIAGFVALETHRRTSTEHARNTIVQATVTHGNLVTANSQDRSNAHIFEERLIQAYYAIIAKG